MRPKRAILATARLSSLLTLAKPVSSFARAVVTEFAFSFAKTPYLLERASYTLQMLNEIIHLVLLRFYWFLLTLL